MVIMVSFIINTPVFPKNPDGFVVCLGFEMYMFFTINSVFIAVWVGFFCPCFAKFCLFPICHMSCMAAISLHTFAFATPHIQDGIILPTCIQVFGACWGA